MKITLIGYGRMGRQLEQLARKRGHTVIWRVDPLACGVDARDILPEKIRQSDVCIEFTHPSAVLDNLKALVPLGVPVVCGTTGWFDSLPEIQDEVEKAKTGLVYAPNFSLGMNFFIRLAEQAAKWMNRFDEYDAAGFEAHHNGKADAPSGTARLIAETVMKRLDRKTDIVYHPGDRKVEAHELHFASLRCGSVPGTHSLFFDSLADTLELKHTARNREGFASGAMTAAEWILGKSGCWSFSQVLEEVLKEN